MRKIAGIIVGSFGVLAIAPVYLWVFGLEPHYYNADRGTAGVVFAIALIWVSVLLLWE